MTIRVTVTRTHQIPRYEAKESIALYYAYFNFVARSVNTSARLAQKLLRYLVAFPVFVFYSGLILRPVNINIFSQNSAFTQQSVSQCMYLKVYVCVWNKCSFFCLVQFSSVFFFQTPTHSLLLCADLSSVVLYLCTLCTNWPTVGHNNLVQNKN